MSLFQFLMNFLNLKLSPISRNNYLSTINNKICHLLIYYINILHQYY